VTKHRWIRVLCQLHVGRSESDESGAHGPVDDGGRAGGAAMSRDLADICRGACGWEVHLGAVMLVGRLFRRYVLLFRATDATLMPIVPVGWERVFEVPWVSASGTRGRR
jgi:hypothetical protein